MAKKVIRAFAPDSGRVIMGYSHQRAYKAIAPYSSPVRSESEIRRIIRGVSTVGDVVSSTIQDRHETGVTNAEQYFAEIQDAIGLTGLDLPTFERLWGDIHWVCPSAEEVEGLLSRIRDDVKFCLVSNNNPTHWKDLQRYTVFRHFFGSMENRVLSFEVGVRKPHRAMFDALVAKTGVLPEETLFVDDITEYVETARALGFNAEQYDCSRDPFSKFEDILREYGLLDPPA